jgi:hypothetical protein
MQINPEFWHLIRKDVPYVYTISKLNYSFDDLVIKSRLILMENGLHLVSNVRILPGDDIVDVAAFDNGYTDVVRKCEDAEDAKYVNSVSGLYQKLLAGPGEIGAFLVLGEVNHDRTLEIGKGYTIEILHPNTIQEILNNSGECYVLVESPQPTVATKFVGKVLIIPADQQKELKTKTEKKH